MNRVGSYFKSLVLGTSSLAKEGRRGLNLGDHPDWILTLFSGWTLASSRPPLTALYSSPLFVSLLSSHIRGVTQAGSGVPTSASSRPQAGLSLTGSSSAVTGMVLAWGCLIANVLGLTQDFRLKLWVHCMMAVGSWPSRSCVRVPWHHSGHWRPQRALAGTVGPEQCCADARAPASSVPGARSHALVSAFPFLLEMNFFLLGCFLETREILLWNVIS